MPPDPENTTGGGVYVDSESAIRFLPRLFKILTDNPAKNMWHKFTVKTPITDRKAVITAINEHIHPLRLVPYFFRMEDGCITFLANNCNNVLFNLIKRKLKIPFTSASDSCKQIELALKIHFKNMDFSEVLQKIVTSRTDPARKIVDLSYLNSMPEIQEVAYDPCDVSHLLHQLVAVVPAVAPRVVSLSLAGNGLRSLHGLNAAFVQSALWETLRVLDLTDNNIDSLAHMMSFQRIPLVELYLDQNPVCGQYRDDASYISAVRLTFRHVLKLDGTYLHDSRERIPYWKQNYIHCDSSGELADQFVEHFFTLYDAEDRSRLLRGLYHRDAYFSTCYKHLRGQSTSDNAWKAFGHLRSRNLLMANAEDNNRAALTRGDRNILARLAKVPRTRHDPYSFTVDLLCNTGSTVILTVTGVFREASIVGQTSVRHFMRTFILVTVTNGEYQIINDMMFVQNAMTWEAEIAFKYTRPQNYAPLPQLARRSKESMVDHVSQLTDMRTEWSRKCLSDCDWDMKEALEVFIELYKVKKIPDEAFKSHELQEEAEA